VRVWIALALVAACGDSHKAKPADAPVDDPFIDDAPVDANPLDDLMGTGLCMDKACTQINTQDIYEYTPRYALWADAASKRRWIYLPPGTQIDTTDPDHWLFPTGTKIWKEFTSGSTRVETRFIWHMGTGNAVTDWFYVAYQWNATNDDATAVPTGASDVNGTTHDIPSRAQCKACHENFQPSRVLGFGAIQLDLHAAAGELDLDGVIANNWLTAPPPGTTPRYPMPSLHGQEPAALGYLHANCGHCHNPNSQVYTANGITMVLRESVATLGSVGETPPYMTAVGQTAKTGVPGGQTTIVVPGDPTMSSMISGKVMPRYAGFHDLSTLMRSLNSVKACSM